MSVALPRTTQIPSAIYRGGQIYSGKTLAQDITVGRSPQSPDWVQSHHPTEWI
ncbi:MAG: hypothetical protein AAF327_01340 [Cyanobacteria bacterium P01_A01_bin.37]